MGVILYTQLCLRVFSGFVLLSTGASKLAHRTTFEQGIRDYQVIPHSIESSIPVYGTLSWGIPIAEIVSGTSLLSGILLAPSTLLAIAMLVLFSAAIAVNLVRKRYDLSCHCAGILGDHLISWRLVGRNAVFVLGLSLCLLAPSISVVSSTGRWISSVLPVFVAVSAGITLFYVIKNARVLFPQ